MKTWLGTIGLCLLIAGCDRGKPAPIALARPPVRVSASVYAIADLVKQIGGPYVTVDSTIETGQSLNDFSITQETRSKLGLADLIVAGGITEPWAVGTIDSPFAADHLVRMDRLDAAATRPNGSAYVWLDPRVARAACAELGTRLATRRPSHDVYFQSQAGRLSMQIESTGKPFLSMIQTLPPSRRTVVALSYEYDALLDWAGIRADHTVVSANGNLSDTELRQLREAAVLGGGISVILLPADAVDAQAADLAVRSGMKTVLLDPFGSASIDGRTTYVELMNYNLQLLQKALAP